MERIPTGVSRLDDIFGGGAPPGSVVLLAGEPGAGAREFMFTSAAMNAVAGVDDDLFDLYYGGLNEAAHLPEAVEYVSFTGSRSEIVDEMHYAMADELVDAAVEDVAFEDFSAEYFSASRVPTDWYEERPPDLQSLNERTDRRDILDAIGDHLSERGPGSLICLDSVTDLITVSSEQMSWNDLTLLMKGLKKASSAWGGLVLLLVNSATLTDTQMGLLMDAADGTLEFQWETGGSERARTMVIQQFRGVLSRLEAENIVQFETEIHDGGFDVSNVRKIR